MMRLYQMQHRRGRLHRVFEIVERGVARLVLWMSPVKQRADVFKQAIGRRDQWGRTENVLGLLVRLVVAGGLKHWS